MSQDQVKVGVVVPMYNAENTISATLQSVFDQTYRDLDIVVVDDGSTDGSLAIVREWQARDPRIRLVQQTNSGVAVARNTGAAATDAQFLAFVDADDLWSPLKIELQLRTLQEGGMDVGLVYSWYATIGLDDRIVTLGPKPRDAGWVLESLCAYNLIGNGSTLLVRRAMFEAARGYDPSLRARGYDGAEDFLFCFRMSEITEFRVVPRYLVGYRQTPNSMSTHSLRMFRASNIVLLEYRRRFPQYSKAIDAQRQDFRYWFGWGALRRGQLFDAFVLIGASILVRPFDALRHYAKTAWATLKRRLPHHLEEHAALPPSYTETTW
jgi:glycosyltransferase involved in cell wall biosynthesis